MKHYRMMCTIIASMAIPWKLRIVFMLSLVVLGLFLAGTSQVTSLQATVVTTSPMCEAFPIVTADSDQHVPTLAYNPRDNEYLLVYVDSSDVAGLRLRADGTPISNALLVATGINNEIAVTYNAQTDKYLVVWTQHVEGYDSSVYGRCVSAEGELEGGRIDVAVRPGRQRSPAVADCENTYLVVWDEDEDASPGWNFYIFGQQVSGCGQSVGETTPASADYPHPGNQQISPDIVYNTQRGECLVVFRDARDFQQGSGFNDDIYGQRLSCDGEPLLENDFPISTQYSEPPGCNAQNAPRVVHDDWHDQYLVVWHDERNKPDISTGDDYLDIYAQVLSGDGMPMVTSEDENFPIAVADNNQWLPDVAYSGQTDEYLVVWEDHRGDQADIYAQRVSDSGTLLGEEIIISNAPGDQLRPRVTYNEATGQFLVVWEDHCNQETCPDVYGCFYLPPPLPPPTPTDTPTPTNTPTHTPLPTVTSTPTNTPTSTPTPTSTATPTDTPTATPTNTPIYLYLPRILYSPPTWPPNAEAQARNWLDGQTVHFERAEYIPGYDRDGCSRQVVRYKDGQKICQPAIPGDALVSFDYCNYGTPDQRYFLGRHGRAFLYDQAVGAIAWLMANETEKAQRLLDYLSSYQNLNEPVPGAADGSFGFSFNTVGCPAYAPDNRDSFYDLDYLRNGAISWAGCAFVLYQNLTSDARYLGAARRTADYLLTQQVTDSDDPRFGLLRGGHGSYDTTTWDFIAGQVEWVSTEHNVDAYFFLRDLGVLTGDERYILAAQQIGNGLLNKLWNEEKGRLDGGQLNGVDALDAASWGAVFLLAIGEEDKARRSLTFAEHTFWNQADGVRGYKPYAGTVEGINWNNVHIVWSEGSLGVAMAYMKLGDANSLNRAQTILAEMSRLQEPDPTGGLLYAVHTCDDLTEFPRAPSVGGTGWFVMALRAFEDPTVRDAFWDATP